MRFSFFVLVAIVLSSTLASGCTTLLAGKGATIDGSLLVSHNNDCTDCDVRLASVPGRTHSLSYDDLSSSSRSGSCPIYPCKFTFPRFIGKDKGPDYDREKLYQEQFQGKDKLIKEWPTSKPIGHTKQVSQTYRYLDGTYGISNEHQLSMGESTCAARLVAYGYPLGDALYDISELSRIALQRCKTARCAISTMGELAETYGYYGANDPPEEGEGMYEESGEALTIIDKHEAWVFHILPDDTGKSAVWAAQRLLDDHFTIVPNKFIIRQIDFNNPAYFMWSKNMIDVAVRNNFWPKNNTSNFDFAGAFAPDAYDPMGWADRRTWRVYNMVAPSLRLRPNQKQPFPFSVKVDSKLSVEDFFTMSRDHFEGTPYDLSRGPAAGPFNNPNRYDRIARPEYMGGYFERAISLHRTSYSFVAQSRAWLPDEVGGIVWFAQHAPHSSIYFPLLPASKQLPPSYTRGNIFQFTHDSAWWTFAALENYVEKSYVHMQEDVVKQQKFFQDKYHQDLKKLEKAIVKLYKSNDNNNKDAGSSSSNKEIVLRDQLEKQSDILSLSSSENQHVLDQEVALTSSLDLVTTFTVAEGEALVEHWRSFLGHLYTKYRDGAKLLAFAPPVDSENLFYPAWWLGRVGFYDYGPFRDTTYPMPPPPPHPMVGQTTDNSTNADNTNAVSQNSTAPTPTPTAPTTLIELPWGESAELKKGEAFNSQFNPLARLTSSSENQPSSPSTPSSAPPLPSTPAPAPSPSPSPSSSSSSSPSFSIPSWSSDLPFGSTGQEMIPINPRHASLKYRYGSTPKQTNPTSTSLPSAIQPFFAFDSSLVSKYEKQFTSSSNVGTLSHKAVPQTSASTWLSYFICFFLFAVISLLSFYGGMMYQRTKEYQLLPSSA